MGFLNGLLGTASKADMSKVAQEFNDLTIPGEEIQSAYQLVRDLIVFTNYRLIFVDKQGMTGKKKEYVCIPYRSVDFYSIETAGHMDLDSEIKIWVRNRPAAIELKFRRGEHLNDVFKALSYYVAAA